MPKRQKLWRSVPVVIAAMLATGTSVHADHFPWSGGGADNNFSTSGNWSLGSPPTATEGPSFDGLDGGDNIMTMDVAATVSNVYFANGADFLIGGSEILTIDGNIFVDDSFQYTINAPISAGSGTFAVSQQSGGLVIGGDVDLGTNTADFAIDVASGAGTQIDGVITGVGGSVSKTGGGTLTLNSANTYDGGTTLSDGTLGIGNNDALGTGALTINGGSLEGTGGPRLLSNNLVINSDFAVTAASDGLTFEGTTDLGGGTRTFTMNQGGATFLNLSGEVSNGGIIKTGTGSLGLHGNNTFAGGVTLQDGRIHIGSDTAMGTGSLTVDGEGELFVNGDVTAANDIALNADLLTHTSLAGNTLTLDGVISGQNGLQKIGDGTLVLTGANTYEGGTTLNAGTLGIGNDDALGIGGLTVAGDSSLTASAGSRDLANNVVVITGNTLTVDGASDLALSGTVSGDGALNKSGAGTLTLANTNSYTGGTTLDGGSVVVGDLDALGTGDVTVSSAANLGRTAAGDPTIGVNNDITLNADLTLQGPGSLSMGGIISGGSGLVLSGDTVVIGNDNTYSGGTTLNSGTLVVSSDDSLGTGALTVDGAASLSSIGTRTLDNDVALNADLTAAGADDITFSADSSLSGGSALIKDGTGTLTFADDSGASSGYTGAITLNNGGLVLNREVGGDLSVAGGSLSGAGTIGGNLVATGGTIAPGNSIGTMNVAGDFTLGAGATLSIEIDPLGNADLVDATGSATLADGSTIDVSLDSGTADDLTEGDEWTIISTGTGITDNGATILSNVTGYRFLGQIFGNDYRLTADLVTLEEAVSGTRRKAIAAALDADVSGDAGLQTLQTNLLGQPLADTNAYLDATTPEPVDAVFTGVGLRVSQKFHGTLNNYLRARRHGVPELARTDMGGQHGVGVQLASAAAEDPATLALFIAQTEQAGDADAEAEGGEAGEADRDTLAERQPRPRIGESAWGGFATAYGVFDRRDSSTNTLGADTDTVAGQFGIDYEFDDNWLAGMSFTYAHSDVDFHNDRGDTDVDTVRVGPYLSYNRGPWFANASATYGYHGNDLTRRAGGDSFTADYDAHDIALYAGLGRDFHLGDQWTLTPEASLQYIYYDADDYTESGGPGALVVESSDFDSLRSSLGVSLSRRFELGGMTIIPDVHVGWAHEFLNDGDSLNARFVNGTTPFTIRTTGTDEDSIFYGAGVTALLNPRTSLGLSYEGETFADEQVHAVVARLRFNF